MTLSSTQCKYCGALSFGTDTDHTYHIYKEHGIRILRECFDKGYEDHTPEICKILFTKEQAYQIILKRMKEIDKELETLK